MRNILSLGLLAMCCVALTLARPSYLPPTYEHIEYTPTVVGHTLHSIPTAVSHQSQTIVHEKRPYLRPIVSHTPTIVKSYEPVLKSYAPVVKSYAPVVKSYSPVVKSYAPYESLLYSPLSYSGLYDHDWSPSFSSPVYGGWSAWPIK